MFFKNHTIFEFVLSIKLIKKRQTLFIFIHRLFMSVRKIDYDIFAHNIEEE